VTRLGYQIPNFTYPGVAPADLFGAVAAQAQAADSAGFDTVLVMDHFYQLPHIGKPEQEMFECYTLLGALAPLTKHVRLSALVTGNTYRNPTLLAKCVTALDVISGGRGQLGIGAGWFELEHESLGYEFGTFTDRFEKLEESLQIVVPMLRGERPSFTGKHYRVHDAVNSPAALSRIPVMIGGGGERKTLRMVAQYADESNLICETAQVQRKLDALAEHCDRLGRDRSEITVSWQRAAVIAPTHEAAEAEFRQMMGDREMSAELRAMVEDRIAIGTPDAVGEKFSSWLVPGIDGFTVNAVANGHNPDRVSLLGETLAKVVGV
jgi:F420-dependent oxidoreductase-like protein